MNWKKKTEHRFEKLSDFIFNNKYKVVLFVLMIFISLAYHLKDLRMDYSTEGFLHEKDPRILQYNALKNQFGRDEKVIIIISSPDVFSKESLTKLYKLHKELENKVPHIDKVNSLISSRNTKGTKDSLIVDDLFKKLPKSKQEILIKKNLALTNPLLKDMLVDKDGKITTIIIDTATYSTLNDNKKENIGDGFEDDGFSDESRADVKKEYITNEENTQIVKSVQQIIKKYQSDDFKLQVAGSSVFASELKSSMKRDMQKFIKILFVIIIILLYVLLRRISGVILPGVAVIMTILSSISLMAISNTPITMITQILPVFLLAVTIGASVHLLAIFFKDFNLTKDKQKSLRYAMGHSGLAIVMTSLTTAAGLFSFSFSAIAPVGDLGIFASAGIVIGLLYVLVFLPALLSIARIKPKDIEIKDNKEVETLMDKILNKIADISIKHPFRIIIISGVLMIVAILTASNLRFSHNPIKWFDEKDPTRTATMHIDKTMNGSSSLDIVIDTKKENGLYDPKVLNAMDEFNKAILKIKTDSYYVGKTISIIDVLKETNKALHENKKEYYKVPQKRDLIAQELFLFSNSGSDDLEDLVDSRFSKARITVKLPMVDAIKYIDLLKDIDVEVKKYLSDIPEVNVTGISALFAQILQSSIHSSAISYVIAIILITLMMIILVGDLKIGLISMIPNISPILVMTTIMVIFDMPLDMFTMLIGSIALGLAVDDTVHFMYNFQKYRQEHNDANHAIRMTLMSTGRAMIITTIVLASAFFVFMGATLSNIFNFGLLTGIAIIVALLADFLLVPAIVKVMKI